MAANKVECEICCETVSAKSMCPCANSACSKSACQKCTQRHVTSVTEPSCMFCKAPWPMEHMQAVLTKTFMGNDYREHRRLFLFEQQRAQFPATMVHIEAAKQAERIKQELDKAAAFGAADLLEPPTVDIDNLEGYADTALEWGRKKLAVQTASTYNRSFSKIMAPIVSLLRRIGAGDRNATAVHIGGVGLRWFNRPCPVDGCRGFLNKAWKCAVCDLHVCARCCQPKGLTVADRSAHERVIASGGSGDDAAMVTIYKNAAAAADAARAKSDAERTAKNLPEPANPHLDLENHVCNDGDLATAAMISHECKACPKEGCGALITRIEGCDQMFCVKCLTAFSWATGKIANGRIHNPHYYEFMRNQKLHSTDAGRQLLARERGDVPCGGMPSHEDLSERMVQLLQADGALTAELVSTWEWASTQAARLAQRDVDPRIVKMATARMKQAGAVERVLKANGLYEILAFIRVRAHVLDTEMRACEPEDMLPLRIAYLQNRTTTEKFQARVQVADLHNLQRAEHHRVWDMFAQTATDIIMRLMVLPTQAADGTTIMPELAERGADIPMPATFLRPGELLRSTVTELKALREYVNGCFAKIGKRYNSSTIKCITEQTDAKDMVVASVPSGKGRVRVLSPQQLQKLRNAYGMLLMRALWAGRSTSTQDLIVSYKDLLTETQRAAEAAPAGGSKRASGDAATATKAAKAKRNKRAASPPQPPPSLSASDDDTTSNATAAAGTASHL